MLAAIRSVLFILIMAITVTIYATATVLCFFLPVKVRYAIASRVKSESLDTMQKPSKLPLYSKSIASMTSAISVAFLPLV